MSKILDALRASALFALAGCAQANMPSINQSCRSELAESYEHWRFAPITQEVADFAKSRHEDPTTTYGDFDDDGLKDVAFLIQVSPNLIVKNPDLANSLVIAVCLSTRTKQKLYLVEKPYCGDGIALSKKGTRFYNYGTGKRDSYRLDGISAYCFEKAGATYQFNNGSFQAIVDSD